MHQYVGSGLLRRTAVPPGRASRVAVPPAAHACSALSHVDHEDAVIVEVGLDQERAGSGPSDLASHSRSSPEPRSGRGGWALGLRLGAARSADPSSASRRRGEKEREG
jgi:hypothetical protein